VGTPVIRVVLAETRNRHTEDGNEKAKCQNKMGMKSETPRPAWHPACCSNIRHRARRLSLRNPPNTPEPGRSLQLHHFAEQPFTSFSELPSQLRAGIAPVPPSSENPASPLREPAQSGVGGPVHVVAAALHHQQTGSNNSSQGRSPSC